MVNKLITVLIYLSSSGLIASIVGMAFIEFDLSTLLGNKTTYGF